MGAAFSASDADGAGVDAVDFGSHLPHAWMKKKPSKLKKAGCSVSWIPFLPD